MLWTSITLKLRHLWRILLTYLAYEAITTHVLSYLNYVPSLALILFLGAVI